MTPPFPLRFAVAAVVACALGAGVCSAQTSGDPAAAMDRAIVAAEARLAAGDTGGAEGHYRVALFEGWLLLARLERHADGVARARDAVGRAAAVGPPDERAALALASAQLELGEATRAVTTLAEHGSRDPRDLATVRLSVRALAAAGREPEAVRVLDEAAAASPADPEVAFVLATDYLWLKRADTADQLMGRVIAAHPAAETHVLVGRAYRDTGEYARARRELARALALDPRVRRAHYYLGTVDLSDPAAGPDRIDRAIAEFREELAVGGDDALVLDQLGLALLEAGRPDEALPAFEAAVRGDPRAPYWHHLGRALLSVGRTADAVAALRRALELTAPVGEANPELEQIHYRLGTALRLLGPDREQEAASHFADAKRLAAHWTDSTQQFTALEPAAAGATREAAALAPAAGGAAAAAIPPAEREALLARVRTALARSYLNLGVVQVRAQQFARAADLLVTATALEPALPGAQFALGVARFNAGDVAGASGPLARAVGQDPGNRAARRLLALASLGGEACARAAALLEDDPDTAGDPALQAALGQALAQGGRAPEAEALFTRLLRAHGPSAPLFAGLGEALAQQGRYDAATEAISKAFEVDPRVADARTTMGFVHLQQGRAAQAAEALRAELAARPGLARPQRLLAEALLAQGQAAEAAQMLRALADAWPEAAQVRLALSRAYERLGKTEDAAAQLEAYRALTAKTP